MGESTQPGTPKLYRLAILRPSSDPKTPKLKDLVSEKLFLFTESDGEVSPDVVAKRKAEKLQESLPPGWEAKVTEVYFTVTRGTPTIVGTCRRASCPNFGKAVPNRIFCPKCGELPAIEMIATEK